MIDGVVDDAIDNSDADIELDDDIEEEEDDDDQYVVSGFDCDSE